MLSSPLVDLSDILTLAKAFRDHDVSYVVVGGIALNLHGLARATADIDLFVDPSPENIARLRGALMQVFRDPDIEQITADDLSGDYPTIQYGPPTGDYHIDLLARLGTAFTFADIEAEEIIVEGVPIKVATAKMLYRMKRDTVRLQDKADAERLWKHFKWAKEPS